MTCEEYQELLSAYVDDELENAEQQLVESHVAHCSKCQETVKTYQRLKKSLQTEMVPADGLAGFEEEIIQQIRQLRQEIQVRRLALVIAVVMALGLGISFFLIISPFGVMVAALFRLTISALHGYLYSLQAMGSIWYGASIIACLIFAGLAVIGIVRLLRSVKSEVAL